MSDLNTSDSDSPTSNAATPLSDVEETIEEESLARMPVASNVPSVCCALLASMTTGGATYAFGLYGSALKRNLHLTQSELDTISTWSFCAGLFSWIPGMFIDKFGVRFGISLGGLTGASSLMLYWVVAKGFVTFSDKSLVVAALSILGVIAFLSCALVTGSVFKIISCACGAGTKGAAVGVAKGYVGLGAGAYACLFESIRQPTSSDLDFLPMAAFFFVVAASIPSWIILPKKKDEGKVLDVFTPLHFKILYASLVILAILIVSSSLEELWEERHESRKVLSPNYLLSAAFLFTWVGPIVGQTLLPKAQHMTTATMPLAEEEQVNLLSSSESVEDLSTEDLEDGDNHLRVEGDPEVSTIVTESDSNKNLYQMLRTPEAWLMIWTTTILVGAGTVETNNLGQMVESLNFPDVVTPSSLALFSVAQALGRVSTGSVSENALSWNTRICFIDKGVPRPFFLSIAGLVGIIAHSILAVSTHQVSFVIGIALSGFSFGMVWPMMVLIIGELFGTAHVGANYLFFDGFTSAGGTFLLSKVVAQQVYERSEAPGSVTCYGQNCFRLTHIVIAVLTSTCVVSSFLMQYITRHAYNKASIQQR